MSATCFHLEAKEFCFNVVSLGGGGGQVGAYLLTFCFMARGFIRLLSFDSV